MHFLSKHKYHWLTSLALSWQMTHTKTDEDKVEAVIAGSEGNAATATGEARNAAAP